MTVGPVSNDWGDTGRGYGHHKEVLYVGQYIIADIKLLPRRVQSRVDL